SRLAIVPIWPGYTLGGIFFASYDERSTLVYDELIALAAIARCGSCWGGWIAGIYVSASASVAGGREIWGLPKQLADFRWDGDRVSAIGAGDPGQLLCELTCKPMQWGKPMRWRTPLPIPGAGFGQRDGQLLHFGFRARARLSIAEAHVTIPAASPLSWLGFSQPQLTIAGTDLDLKVAAPQLLSDE
ncbi:acetoacetate decarboxylase, partial [Rubidibacter lacunae KORDI 51-2]